MANYSAPLVVVAKGSRCVVRDLCGKAGPGLIGGRAADAPGDRPGAPDRAVTGRVGEPPGISVRYLRSAQPRLLENELTRRSFDGRRMGALALTRRPSIRAPAAKSL